MSSATPMILIMLAAAALGGYNLLLWLRGARRPGLIAGHLLLGVAGAETLVMFVHNSGLADDDPARGTAKFALYLFGAAIFAGFAAPLLGKNNRQTANALLFAHVGTALAGLFVVLTIVSRL